MKKNCLYCGKEIHVKPSQFERKKYCSRACKTNYQKKNPPNFWEVLSKKQTVFCSYCNNQLLRKPSAINERNFCNQECKKQYQLKYSHTINQHLRHNFTVICHYCKTEFIVPKNRVQNAKYCSKKCLGKANGDRGKVQYKKRMKVNCTNCSREFEKKPSTIRKLNFCSVECMGIYYEKSQMFAGENNGAWAGGDLSYYGPNWYLQRRKARKRDNYTCQDCGITENEYGRELSVHHIIPFRKFMGNWKKANELSNLITLCEYPCHRKRHSKMVDDIV